MEVKVIIGNKEVKGFIIEEIDGFYKIGTYLGIIYRRKETVDKLNHIDRVDIKPWMYYIKNS